MNDKCAGGTGAVIDKINAKLRIPPDELGDQGYHGHQAAPGRRQVRRVRRNRHQRSAEGGHAARRADGVAVRRDRPAEPDRADPRPHAAAARPAARRAEHVHPRHARSVAAQHPEDRGRSAASRFPDGATPEIAHQSARRTRSTSRALGAVEFGRDEESHVGALPRHRATLEHYIDVGRRGREGRRPAARGLASRTRSCARFSERYSAEAVHPGDVRARPGRARASSASTADRPPPRPCCCRRTATCSARSISCRTAIRSRTPSTCSTNFARRSTDSGRDARGRSASARPATRRTS